MDPEPDDLNDFLNVAFYTIRYIYNKKNSFDDTTVKKVRSYYFRTAIMVFLVKEHFEDFKDNIKFDNLHEVLPKQKQKEVQGILIMVIPKKLIQWLMNRGPRQLVLIDLKKV